MVPLMLAKSNIKELNFKSNFSDLQGSTCILFTFFSPVFVCELYYFSFLVCISNILPHLPLRSSG